MFTAEAFAKLMSFIGVRGFIIIGLVVIMTGEGLAIKASRAKITSLNETITANNTKIKEQNASIEAAANVAKSVQKKLDDSETANAKLNKDYTQLKNSINNQPVAKDCPSAVIELRGVQTNLVKRWNK